MEINARGKKHRPLRYTRNDTEHLVFMRVPSGLGRFEIFQDVSNLELAVFTGGSNGTLILQSVIEVDMKNCEGSFCLYILFCNNHM